MCISAYIKKKNAAVAMVVIFHGRICSKKGQGIYLRSSLHCALSRQELYFVFLNNIILKQ